MLRTYYELYPQPPDFLFQAGSLWLKLPALATLDSCPQSPLHHAEGDVGIHTRMVCEWLANSGEWRNLDESGRRVTFWAALLHDIAKPATTRKETDGCITSPGHSRLGELMTRGLLWEWGVPFAEREMITQLIRFHQYPFFLVERPDALRKLYEISQTTSCAYLALISEADARGRICQDQQRLLDNIELFRLLAKEEDCLHKPRDFPSPHSRFLYFRLPHRNPNYLAYNDTICEVTILSGLPGAGKSTWAQQQCAALPQVCLDDIRQKLDIKPTDEQGLVLQTSREMAREFLRRKVSFIWNATNISRQRRQPIIELLYAYNASVRIVYVEVNESVLFRQNAARDQAVPTKVINNMIARWEIPDLTEAHRVDYII